MPASACLHSQMALDRWPNPRPARVAAVWPALLLRCHCRRCEASAVLPLPRRHHATALSPPPRCRHRRICFYRCCCPCRRRAIALPPPDAAAALSPLLLPRCPLSLPNGHAARHCRAANAVAALPLTLPCCRRHRRAAGELPLLPLSPPPPCCCP